MENQDEEQEYLDFRSPKGQLIKLLEQKCKKPVIDDSLGEVLDKFISLNEERNKYLENGIFNMNFTEDALLLQSCATYYGKRVDKLWEELLQLHSRLLKCDQRIDKDDRDNSEKIEARQTELLKLEERLNRRKRKKIALVEEQNTKKSFHQSVLQLNCMDTIDELLASEHEDVGIGEESKIPFELDHDVLSEWRNMELKKSQSIESTMSPLVSQFHRQTYRMKNYLRPQDENDIIYDVEDPEEFYTRRSRIPTYDVIMHLFEYNDRCLLPDNKNATIAKLRLAFVEKKKYMIRHNLTFETPYEEYKEDYERFCQGFFDKERRKIQNMPQNTKEEIQAFYKALEKKEQEAWTMKRKLKTMGIESPNVNFNTVILDPLDREDGKTVWRVLLSEQGVEEEEQDSDMQDLHSQEDFAIDLDQVNKAATDKLRSDSGYFESGFATDEEIDHDDVNDTIGDEENAEDLDDTVEISQKSNPESVLEASLISENGTGTESISENPNVEAENIDNSISNDGSGTPDKSNEESENPEEGSSLDDSFKDTTISNEENEDSIVEAVNIGCITKSEHVRAEFDEFIKNHKYIEFPDGCIMIVYNKDLPKSGENEEESNKTAESEETTQDEKLKEKPKIKEHHKKKKEKPVEEANLKRKRESSKETPVKRRKLSDKQMVKLRKSVIQPVSALKFENFFTMNYQPETGEGDVTRVNYEPDMDDDNNNVDCHSDADNDSCRPDSAVDFIEVQNSTPLHIDEAEDGTVSLQNESSLAVPDEEEVLEPQPGCSFWCDTQEEEDLHEQFACPRSTDDSNKTKYEIEREKVRKSVAEWRSYIAPKLKKLDEHDFDIHEYGSNIIDSFETVNEPKLFKSMVNGKPSAEVVRYFISCLQLASTNNIEICGVQEGQLSNDTFGLKLLSKERYHEHLEEYQAPSEECLTEKLNKIKMIKQREKNLQSPKNLKKSKTDHNNLKIVLNRCSSTNDDETTSSTSGTQSLESTPSTSGLERYSRTPHHKRTSLMSESEVARPAKKIKILSCYSVQKGQKMKLDVNQNQSQEKVDNIFSCNDLSSDETDFFGDLQTGGYSHSTPRKSYFKKGT